MSLNTPSENSLTRSGVGLWSTAYLFLRIGAESDHWQMIYQDDGSWARCNKK